MARSVKPEEEMSIADQLKALGINPKNWKVTPIRRSVHRAYTKTGNIDLSEFKTGKRL